MGKAIIGQSFDNATLVKNGTLFISTLDKSLYAIDLKTGITKWEKRNTFGYFLQLAEKNDTIFCTHVGGYYAQLEALNESTGEVYLQVSLADVYGYSGVGILDDNYFYFESGNYTCSHINALDLTSKQIKWSTSCINSGGKIILNDNNLYILPPTGFPYNNMNLLSFSKIDGKLNWNIPNVVDYVLPQNSKISNDAIILNHSDGTYPSGIRAIEKTNGNTLWTKFQDYTVLSIYADNDKIYFSGWEKSGDRGYYLVCAEISSGDVLWRHLFSLGGEQLNKFDKLVVNNNVLYGSCQNEIIASSGYPNSYAIMSFDTNTGKLIDSAKIKTAPLNYVGMNTALYLVTETGKMIGSKK
jgi:outer membrane protein assembly factor BamB